MRVWDRVICRVDTRRRKDIMSNHTATHLLQAALQNIIGEHVKQAGSLVAPDRLRFDFTHFFPISRDEIRSIEDAVNQKVLENINVETSVMDIKDAVASGATALSERNTAKQSELLRCRDSVLNSAEALTARQPET